MKITLLGTSAAEGWPGLFCRCEACGKARTLGGKNIRTRHSTLVDDVIKVDFPPDTLHHVIRHGLDLRSLRALLFTHAHDDHFSAPELQYRGTYFTPSPILDPLPVYGPVDVIQCLETRLNLELTPLSLTTLQPWKTVTIEGGYRVTPIIAQHDPMQMCFNYVLQGPDGVTLLYASDTGWYDETTWRFLEPFSLDAVVVECTKGPIETGYRAHLCISEVVRMREKLIGMGSFRADGVMVTTHFSHLGGLMHNELEAQFHPHHIQVGYDGMTLKIAPRSGQTAPRARSRAAVPTTV